MPNTRSQSKGRTTLAPSVAGVCSNTLSSPRVSSVSAVTASVGVWSQLVEAVNTAASSDPTPIPGLSSDLVEAVTVGPPIVTTSVAPSVVRSLMLGDTISPVPVMASSATSVITESSQDVATELSDDESVAPVPVVAAAAVPVNLDQINAELALLEAQERLLAARLRMQQLQAALPSTSAAVDINVGVKKKIKANDVEYLVSPFTGDDDYEVVKWIEDFEDIMAHLKGDPLDHYKMARHLVRGTAKVYLRTIRVKSYEELKVALTKRYKRHVSYQMVYEELRRRVRQPG